MKILALETTTKNLGVAIYDGESILAEHRSETQFTHAQDTIPAIDRLLKGADWAIKDLDCFVISIGPGSFTGLRVGVAILKGLSLTTKVPIVTVPTLDAIAHNLKDERCPLSVMVDAKKNNLYSSFYTVGDSGIMSRGSYRLMKIDELIAEVQKREERREKTEREKSGIMFTGDGVRIYRDLISGKIEGARFADERLWYPDSKVVARLGAIKFREKDFVESDKLLPMYIYSKECNVNEARTYGAKRK